GGSAHLPERQAIPVPVFFFSLRPAAVSATTLVRGLGRIILISLEQPVRRVLRLAADRNRSLVMRTMIAASAALALLVGCADLEGRPKETGGVLLGGALGGLAGAQVGRGSGQLAATAAGTLLGAFLGSEI